MGHEVGVDELTIPHRLIQQALDQLMAGRTAVVIAHRLSTIRNADLICVVQNGSIIEQGAHEQLIKQAAFTRNCIIANFWQQPSED